MNLKKDLSECDIHESNSVCYNHANMTHYTIYSRLDPINMKSNLVYSDQFYHLKDLIKNENENKNYENIISSLLQSITDPDPKNMIRRVEYISEESVFDIYLPCKAFLLNA